MQLNRHQILSIIGFFVLFLLLFFGCDKQSKKQRALEKSRSQKVEILSIQKVISEAKATLIPEQKLRLDYLNKELENFDDSLQLGIMEDIASEWYQLGHELISAHFAEQIAEKRNDEQSWAIAGTSFAIAQKKYQNKTQKLFANKKAIEAFENASSLNPANADHKINLALSYVDMPPEDNPMKGILMLLDLQRENPKNTKVLVQLGNLAIRTNQIDKAIERFKQVLAINPEHNVANCKLGELLSSRNQIEEARVYLAKCKK